MTRNERTTITKLQIGDRFHLLSDKAKITWTKAQNQQNPNEQNWAQKDGDRFPQPIRAATVLVFLRHASVDAK